MTPGHPAYHILRYWTGGLLFALCTNNVTFENVATWTMAAFGGALLGAVTLDLWKLWRARGKL